MKIEIVKMGNKYEVAVMPKYEYVFSVFKMTKTEIRQLIKRLEKIIKELE